jgi:uncharacterized protein (DUF2236 family)
MERPVVLRFVTDADNEFRAALQALRDAGSSNPNLGYFGPTSMMWRVNRESILHLAGVRAVLMQIAHPKVAQGVADHSRFDCAFLRRALNTYVTANDLIFGDTATATRRALKLYARHSRVRGRVRAQGTADAYAATDQELLTWVYATLVDSTILIHDTFLGTIDEDGWERYYTESKLLATLFGIDADALPSRLEGLRVWMGQMLYRGTVSVTPTALSISNSLRQGNLLVRITQPLNYTIAVGSLPPALAQAYGLSDTTVTNFLYSRSARLSRTVLPRLPATLRSTPLAWMAYRRCRV